MQPKIAQPHGCFVPFKNFYHAKVDSKAPTAPWRRPFRDPPGVPAPSSSASTQETMLLLPAAPDARGCLIPPSAARFLLICERRCCFEELQQKRIQTPLGRTYLGGLESWGWGYTHACSD